MLRGLIQRLFVQPWSATFLPSESLSLPTITPLNALRYTPVYRAVSLIAADIARTPCEISATQAASLWSSPSRYMSAYEFRRSMTLQALLWGNSFAIINRTRGGELLELVPLDPDGVSLDLSGPEPIYKTRMYGDIGTADMLHLRAPGVSGVWGESPVNLCKTSITLLAAQEQMALKAYENAGNPKIALVHPGPLSLEARQRIMQDYEQRHAGSANGGRPLVLAEGMRIERISSTLDDTGLADSRKYSIEDVSRIYGVPPHMLGLASSGNAYGSLEWWGRTYLDACLAHWFATWSAEIVAKLASPYDTVVWDTDALVKPGMAEQMAALRTGVEAGFLTRNEARARLDMPPLPGLDEPTLALNVGTGGGSTNLGTDTSAEGGTPNDF